MGSLAYLVLLVSISLPCSVICQNGFEDDLDPLVVEPEPEDPPIPRECEDKVMDIYFILDSSTSIWVRHYETLLPFVRDVVSRLDIAETTTRVGVISYSDRLNSQPLRLDRYFNKNQIRSYITLNNFPYQTGITNTYDAIRYVRETREFRQDITKVIVVITDGFSSDPGQTAREAELARDEGFYLFVVGLGRYPDEAEWMAIADNPDRDFIYNATSFVFTDFLKNWVARRACSLPPKPPAGACRLKNNLYSSVFYISGSSNTLNAAYRISNRFGEQTRGANPNVQVGFFFQNCLKLIAPFGKADDYCSRTRQNTYTVSSLLNELSEAAREDRLNNGDPSQVAVFFLDEAGGQEISEVDIESLQEDNIEVILLDLSSRGIPNTRRLALTRRENYLRLSGSQEAADRAVAERICTAMNRQRESIDIGPN